MTAYENSMKGSDTRFLLRPDSEFFRYFANPAGKPAAAPGAMIRDDVAGCTADHIRNDND